MSWIPLDSSNLDACEYDDQTQTLAIKFRNGNIYHYFDVPEHVFEGLRTAPSPGQYLHVEIKGIYRYAKD